MLSEQNLKFVNAFKRQGSEISLGSQVETEKSYERMFFEAMAETQGGRVYLE